MTALFRGAPFRRLWLNASLSAASAGGDFVLVGWLALGASGTPAWVGVAYGLYYLPMLVLGVPAGSVADRFDRLALLRGLEIVSGAVLVAFALLAQAGEPGLVLALALALVLGSLRAVQSPVRLGFAYDLVGPTLVTPALAGVSFGTRLGMMAGALAAGTLAEGFGAAPAFLVMAAAHGAAWLALGRAMTGASTQTVDTAPLWQNLKASMSEMRRNRVLLVLILLTAAIEVFGVSFLTLVPTLAEERLGLGAQGLGWLVAAQSAGGLVAGLVMFALPHRRRNAAIHGTSVLCLGLAVMALGAVQGLVASLLVLALVSAMIAVWDIVTQSMMQLSVPDHLRGRAMGAWVFAIGSAPLGHLEIGLLAAAVGADIALYANGACVVAVIVLAYALTPALRRL